MKNISSLKVAIIGYGKMGKAIERIAKDRGHEIIAIINRDQDLGSLKDRSVPIDVCIEFTSGDAAATNIAFCLENGLPVVSGSTGWQGQFKEIIRLTEKQKGAFFYASNFSVGVHLFMKTARQLSRLMNGHTEYDVFIEEAHHIFKKDAPSGTAITLAETVLEELKNKEKWKLSCDDHLDNEIPVAAKRIGQEYGYHRLLFHSPIDAIGLDHRAFTRDGFALGAVLAAEFLIGKSGFYGMDDLLE